MLSTSTYLAAQLQPMLRVMLRTEVRLVESLYTVLGLADSLYTVSGLVESLYTTSILVFICRHS